MDGFNAYLKLDRKEETIEHVRQVVAGYIPWMKGRNEYSTDFYAMMDKRMKKEPVTDAITGVEHTSLKDLANAIADRYEQAPGEPMGEDEYRQLTEDPEAYMALNFGL